MTTIATHRCGWTDGKKYKLLVILGDQHGKYLLNILNQHVDKRVAHYAFGLIFDGSNEIESGIHNHIEELEFVEAPPLYKVAALLKDGFTLDNYDRIRRERRVREDSFAPYQRLETRRSEVGDSA